MSKWASHRRHAGLRATPPGGFTLIELVVVVLIIALLSTVAVVSLGGTTDRYQLNQAVHTMQRCDARLRRDARSSRAPQVLVIERSRGRVRVLDRDVSFELPRHVQISEIKVDRVAVVGRSVELTFNREGVSPSYAMQLQRGESTVWLVVLGFSGQMVSLISEEEVDAILSM